MAQRKKKPFEDPEMNKVLKYQQDLLRGFDHIDLSETENNIQETELLLSSLGIPLPDQNKIKSKTSCEKKIIKIPSWEELVAEANEHNTEEVSLESLFTQEEIEKNRNALIRWEAEYNSIHKFDKIDVAICGFAAVIGATIDILSVGIPEKTMQGLKAGSLSDFIRRWFDKRFPDEKMQALANSKISKVPYDAQDNRNTGVHVEGLSAYYHRLLSLGHDPFLGFVVGVFDIMTGRMTTIDKNGRFVSQIMDVYADRKEVSIFSALAKQIIHLMSDINTSMGLPAPLMGLFNVLQFGSIGKEEQTIAEIVQGMYYEGYDFIHFCSMSIPVMVTEVIVRVLYAFKRISEGHTIKDSIPLSVNREKNPKLASMLFIAHSGATFVNLGKIMFTKNPLAINYPQWLAFSRYAYLELKWALVEKPLAQYYYLEDRIEEEVKEVYGDIDEIMRNMSDSFVFIEE